MFKSYGTILLCQMFKKSYGTILLCQMFKSLKVTQYCYVKCLKVMVQYCYVKCLKV